MHRLLGNKALGGGNAEGHAKVVALHLFKLFKSTTVFTEVMKTAIKQINCLEYFRNKQLLQVHVYATICVSLNNYIIMWVSIAKLWT